MTFEDKVAEILSKYDPGRKYLASRIAKNFRGNEGLVLARLKEVYSTGGVANLTIAPKKSTPKIEAAPVAEEDTEEILETVAEVDSDEVEENVVPEENLTDEDIVEEDKEEAAE